MRRTLPYLALGLVLGLGAGFLAWLGSDNKQTYFCDAASEPDSYTGEWFYRLQPAPGGWLVRSDDLETTLTLNPRTLEYLTTLDKALKGRGVTLIVAAQPPRGVVLAADSLPDYTPDDTVAAYEAARNTLQNVGLSVTDLAAVAVKTPNYFFRRDHHWTPDGSRASAEAVAQILTSTPAFGSLRAKQRTFKTRKVRTEAQIGSYGEAVGRICGKAPRPERLTRYETGQTRSAEALTETPADNGLFGTSAPPITLAGTSNSVRKDLNFEGFLEQATGLEVLNVATVGGGPQAALEAYLRSETFRQAQPAFIVWEFATLFNLPQNPLFYRQLIPSVRGVCDASAETSVTKAAGQRVPLFADLTGGNKGFLYLELSDLSQTTFSLELGYADGQVERVTLERSHREHNDGRFFLSFSKPLKSATLTLPEGTSGAVSNGTVQARLCQ